MRYESVPFTNVFKWYSRFVKKRLVDFRPDIIVASCDSHFGYAAQRIARLLDIPFVFDLYHYSPDFGSSRIPGMNWKFQRAVAAADLVVCDSEVLRNKVVDVAKRILVAQQGVDFDHFRPHDMQCCRREFDLPSEQALIGYTGSLDSRFDWQILQATINALRAKGVSCSFVIAGSQVEKMDLDIDRELKAPGKSNLEGGFPLRCFQRLSCPYIARAMPLATIPPALFPAGCQTFPKPGRGQNSCRLPRRAPTVMCAYSYT
jgi:glycosyltransferase involved in cell wall biosynthesis